VPLAYALGYDQRQPRAVSLLTIPYIEGPDYACSIPKPGNGKSLDFGRQKPGWSEILFSTTFPASSIPVIGLCQGPRLKDGQRRATGKRRLASRFYDEVYTSESVRALLERHGLAGIEAVFSRGASVHARHQGRSVWEAQLIDDQGKPLRIFIKMSWGRRRLWPRMTDLKTGQTFQSLSDREWNGLARFWALGLNVPERLALYRHGLWTVRTAVILREVPPQHSLDEMLKNGRWQQFSAGQREGLLETVMATMQTIHKAGLGWRGTSSRHFYPQLQNDGSWKVWLIDCEGVHGHASGKTFERSYQKLWRSMKESGADRITLERLQSKIERALMGSVSGVPDPTGCVPRVDSPELSPRECSDKATRFVEHRSARRRANR